MAGLFVKTVAFVALQFGYVTALQCHTDYASTSRTHVPTHTTTVTRTPFVNEISTSTIPRTETESSAYPATSTSTVTEEFVYTFFKASTTVTVAPRGGFTPIASASLAPGAAPPKKRAHRRSGDSPRGPARKQPRGTHTSSKYPKDVTCTKIVTGTSTSINYLGTSTVYEATTTRYAHPGSTQTVTTTTYSTSSTTVSVSQATFPAECKSNNLISAFDNYGVFGFSGTEEEAGAPYLDLPCVPNPSLKTDDSCRFTGAARKSPVDCCVAAYNIGAAGFSTWNGNDSTNFPTYLGCQVFKLPANETWNFFVGGSEGDESDFYIGNVANTALFGGYSD